MQIDNIDGGLTPNKYTVDERKKYIVEWQFVGPVVILLNLFGISSCVIGGLILTIKTSWDNAWLSLYSYNN